MVSGIYGTYYCSRCKTELKIKNKIAIYVGGVGRQPRKKWDLCENCFEALERGIAKGKTKK